MAWGSVPDPQTKRQHYYDELTLAQKAALEPPSHHSRRAKESEGGFDKMRQKLAVGKETAKQGQQAKL